MHFRGWLVQQYLQSLNSSTCKAQKLKHKSQSIELEAKQQPKHRSQSTKAKTPSLKPNKIQNIEAKARSLTTPIKNTRAQSKA
jgi:hypothetical protein